MLLGYMYVPLLKSVQYSFFEFREFRPDSFVGLTHYIHVFQDGLFWNSVSLTLKWVAMTALLPSVSGLILALLIDYSGTGRVLAGVTRTILFMPMMMPLVAVGLLWMLIFNPNLGLINALLNATKDTTLKGVQLFADPMVFVNPDIDVPELAIEFLDYHTAPEYYVVSGNYFGALTANKEANKQVNLPPYLKADVLMKQFALPQSNYWTVTFPTQVEEVLARQLQLVLAGQSTPEDALAAVEVEHARHR